MVSFKYFFRESNVRMSKYWETTVPYFLDWNSNNESDRNIMLIPQHLEIHLTNSGSKRAELSGWKVGIRGNYNGVRRNIEHMLKPYGSIEDYQQYYEK